MITEAMVEAAADMLGDELGSDPDSDPWRYKIARMALEAAEAATWQPIKTAPKDGTEILAWDGQDVYLIWWSDTIGLEDGTTGAFVDASMYFGKALTHWRPLPAPPLNDAPSSRGGET